MAARVREIAANRRDLLPLRPLVEDLGRTVKDPWRTGPSTVVRRAAVLTLRPEDTVSVRLDPDLDLEVLAEGPGRPHRSGDTELRLRRARGDVAVVRGDARRLDLLQAVIAESSADPGSTLLPKDLDAFDRHVEATAERTSALLQAGRVLVEEVERLVCGLYGLSEPLTDAVVRHAVGRAARRTPPDV